MANNFVGKFQDLVVALNSSNDPQLRYFESLLHTYLYEPQGLSPTESDDVMEALKQHNIW